ncbi:MAG: sulfurtransferase [Gammaproteobacteria bacterium]|nr:MAG: sulfurtransferase [Gammaproteobacteria bacterium]
MSYTTLISVDALKRNLGEKNWVIFDCRFDLSKPDAGRNAYLEAHIPGARYVHLDDDLAGEVTASSGRHPLPDPEVLGDRLGAWGVDNETQVVVYDGGAGAIASRLWWLLQWLGHDTVAVLDGGFNQWQQREYPLTPDVPRNETMKYTIHVDKNMLVGVQDIERNLTSTEFLLVDARDEKRFRGEQETFDPVAGHIPGAVNLPFTANLSESGCFLNGSELDRIYADVIGEHSIDQVVCMCGSGVSACHLLLALKIIGLKGARLYPGSWSEWVSDQHRPVVIEK